jgi:hypothetical protein
MLRQTHEQFKVTLQLQRMSIASGCRQRPNWWTDTHSF